MAFKNSPIKSAKVQATNKAKMCQGHFEHQLVAENYGLGGSTSFVCEHQDKAACGFSDRKQQ